MTKNIDAPTRRRILTVLDIALQRALVNYEKQMKREVKDDSFKNYHVDGKAALAHIQLLLKLWDGLLAVTAEHNTPFPPDILAALIERAREEN